MMRAIIFYFVLCPFLFTLFLYAQPPSILPSLELHKIAQKVDTISNRINGLTNRIDSLGIRMESLEKSKESTSSLYLPIAFVATSVMSVIIILVGLILAILVIHYLFKTERRISKNIEVEKKSYLQRIQESTDLQNEIKKSQDELNGKIKTLEELYNNMEKISNEHFEKIKKDILSIQENLEKITLLSPVEIPSDPLKLYNQAISSDLNDNRESFISKFTPARVTIESSPELAKGRFASTEYKPRFKREQTGEMMIVFHNAQHLLFPGFYTPFNMPSIAASFKPFAGPAVKGQKKKLHGIRKPAICQQIDNETWELMEEGELIITSS